MKDKIVISQKRPYEEAWLYYSWMLNVILFVIASVAFQQIKLLEWWERDKRSQIIFAVPILFLLSKKIVVYFLDKKEVDSGIWEKEEHDKIMRELNFLTYYYMAVTESCLFVFSEDSREFMFFLGFGTIVIFRLIYSFFDILSLKYSDMAIIYPDEPEEKRRVTLQFTNGEQKWVDLDEHSFIINSDDNLLVFKTQTNYKKISKDDVQYIFVKDKIFERRWNGWTQLKQRN